MSQVMTPRPRRADAQRNYDRILQETRQAVVEFGSDVALEEIARRAGVGIGTLYRHFPTRQALFEATFTDEAGQLAARAERLAADSQPLAALESWFRAYMELGVRSRSMGPSVLNAKHTEGTEIHLACSNMQAAGEQLLGRAQAAGVVRAEVKLMDVLRLLSGLSLANERQPDAAQAERMFQLVMAGIQA